MEFPGHEITFSLTSELHLQLLKKLSIGISLSHFDSVGNCKLQSPIGSSDVRLSWDPMIYGDSWMEYLRFGPSKRKNPVFMITVLNKGRILNSHKWFSAHRYLLWSHSSLSEYFSSPHFLYYMLTTWTHLVIPQLWNSVIAYVHSHSVWNTSFYTKTSKWLCNHWNVTLRHF